MPVRCYARCCLWLMLLAAGAGCTRSDSSSEPENAYTPPPSPATRLWRTIRPAPTKAATLALGEPTPLPQAQARSPAEPEALDFEVYADPDIGPAPLTVRFSALIDEELSNPSFAWNFGDGGTSTNTAPTHTYERAGEYSARLSVSTPAGRHGTRDVVIQVDPPSEDE